MIGTAEAWDPLLVDLEERRTVAAPPHVLQAWEWGEVKSRWGWKVERMSFELGGQPIAAAQAMWRRVGGLPLRVGYIPKGPFVSTNEPEAWTHVLGAIESWSRDRRLAFVKMDADVPADQEALLATWRERGWSPSSDQIQFRNTMRSDLRPDESVILAAMKSKTRYNIRLAERRGVTVRSAGLEGIETALDLYRETGERQGFAIRALDYYRDAWSSWLRAGRAEVLLAECEGRVLAAAIPVRFGGTAWYLYGASSDQMREVMAPYAVMWAAIQWARSSGCHDFDWWGGPETADPADPLWGVYRFKLGFGARLDDQAGAWDFPSRRVSNAIYRGAAKAHSVSRKLRG